MIFIYLIFAAAAGLGVWAVGSLTAIGHLLEAVCLLGLLATAGWSGIAFARRAERAKAVTFAGFCLALMLDLTGHMASGLEPDAVWAYAFFFGALSLPFFMDFVTRFPFPRPKLRWLVFLAYGVSLAVAVLGPLGLLGPTLDPMHPLAVAARSEHVRGGGHSIYAMGPVLIGLTWQVVSLWVLWTSHRSARREGLAIEAQQSLILLGGVVIGWLPTIAFLPHVLPKGMEAAMHGPPALFFGLIPVAGAVALTRPDFYDDRAVFRRVLVGLGLASVVYLLYLLILRPLTLLLDQVQPGFGHDPAVFTAALVVALLTRPIQDWMADQVDKNFFPHLLGFRTLLQETSQALATTIIPADVAKLATESLPERLGAAGAALLVLDDLGQPTAHAVWDQARRANDPTTLRDAAACEDLGLTPPALMLPLRVGGRLVGVYVLGPRYSALNYTRDELSQLRVLGHHLAVAVENGRALRKIDQLSQRALAEVEERNRIAREIHDTIAQGLTAASLQLEVVEATLTENPARAAKATSRAQAIVRDNLAEARRSVLELRAPLLGTDSLPTALGRLLGQAASDIGAASSFQLDGTYRGLPARIENQFYRIAQEALHNAVKYSSAGQLTVNLHIQQQRVSLTISDDGAGFDPALAPKGDGRGGFGLTGMGERARLLGGQLRVISEPGEGTMVKVTVPLETREGESE